MKNYFYLISKARADERLLPSEKNVYAVILELSYKEGFCFATNRYISSKIGMSDRTVKRAISKLALIGYIRISREIDFCGIITRRLYPEGIKKATTAPQKDGFGEKKENSESLADKKRDVVCDKAVSDEAYKRAEEIADRIVKEGFDKALEYLKREKTSKKGYDLSEDDKTFSDVDVPSGRSGLSRGEDKEVSEGQRRPVSMEYMVFNLSRISKKINNLINNRERRQEGVSMDNFEHYRRGRDYYKDVKPDNDILDDIVF